MRISIRELGLPKALLRRLEHEGIRTVAALVKRTPYELLDWPGIGLQSIKAIQRALNVRGLTLKDDPGIRALWTWTMEREKERRRA